MGTITKSAELLKQSFRVLRQDKQLLIFPVLSSIACLAVFISFAAPMLATDIFQSILESKKQHALSGGMKALAFAIGFAYYFVNFFVVVFFNTALVSCAMQRFDGQTPTVRGGIRAAISLLPQILGWALLSATVGMVLRTIGERFGPVGKIVIGLIGMAWTIATYFVVPVLVVERAGPIDAVKRSVSVLSETWGKALVSNVGLGLINVGLFLLCLLPLGIGTAISIAMQHWIPAVIGGAFTLLMLIALALVTSAMQVILVAALYRFASSGDAPAGFDPLALRGAFAPKK